MRKPSRREIARLLASSGSAEPPVGLATRIKAEIPAVIHAGEADLDLERAAATRRRQVTWRPFLSVAATLLVVIGAGFIGARLLRPPADLARDVALGGVTVIDDIAVTVPPRRAAAVPPPTPQPFAPATAGTEAATGLLHEARADAVTVVVRHADGAPYRGATVKLERTDATPHWAGESATDANGVASFPGVPIGTYTLSTRIGRARPARLEMLQVTQGAQTRISLRVARRRT
jgi:hypothetical protein